MVWIDRRIRQQRTGGLYRPPADGGFVLVGSLLILLILALVGISATTSTILELETAGADRTYRETFYQADGGTEFGTRMTLDNAICTLVGDGFTDNSYGPGVKIGDNIVVSDLTFGSDIYSSGSASDTDRALVYYTESGFSLPASGEYDSDAFNAYEHTNIRAGSVVGPAHGQGMQMLQGYDSTTGGSAVSAAHKVFTISSQHVGKNNSESLIDVKWQVIVGVLDNSDVSDCHY